MLELNNIPFHLVQNYNGARGDGVQKEKLLIAKKEKLKGDDGYETFSIRIREETVGQLDKIAQKSGRSRNELINLILEYGIPRIEFA